MWRVVNVVDSIALQRSWPQYNSVQDYQMVDMLFLIISLILNEDTGNNLDGNLWKVNRSYYEMALEYMEEVAVV